MPAGLQQTMARAKREILPQVIRPSRHQLQAERPESDAVQVTVQRSGERVRGATAGAAPGSGLQHEERGGR